MAKKKAANKKFFLQQPYFEEGEGTGHLLATSVKAQQAASYITKIQSSLYKRVDTTPEILGVFREYYQALYKSRVFFLEESLNGFFDTIQLSNISKDEREALEGPLTLDELKKAAGNLPNNKAPGPDGLPGEIYKKYGDALLPELLDVFNYAMEVGSLPPSMNEAIIIVLLKPDKDPSNPDSYRPISLQTSDIKLLAKVLATRLSRYISKLIHRDQSGFILNRSTANNIRRLFLNLQLLTDTMGNRAIMSLDSAKAFDSIEWVFLWNCLKRYGFGPRFIKWIQLLYDSLRARVQVNGCATTPFSLTRGTRPGCPLSPLLFALAIEPLAEAIRSSVDIVGFCRSTGEDKIALYVDDALVFLGDTGPSISAVMSLINLYGSFSGFNSNWDKSVIMLVDSECMGHLHQTQRMSLVTSFKYLGVANTPNVIDYTDRNILPLIVKFRQQSKIWSKLPISMVGRANLVKMVWMPQMLYLSHNCPIWLMLRLFKTINAVFRDFVWRGGKLRIRFEVLQQPIDKGGIAIPNVRLYFIASQLQHWHGWNAVDMEDPIQKIIASQFKNYPLVQLIVAHHFYNKKRFPTFHLIYRVWEAVRNITQHTKQMPIWDNYCLYELNKLSEYLDWKKACIIFLYQLYEGDVLLPFNILKDLYQLTNKNFFQYLQICHALQIQSSKSQLQYEHSKILTKAT